MEEGEEGVMLASLSSVGSLLSTPGDWGEPRSAALDRSPCESPPPKELPRL